MCKDMPKRKATRRGLQSRKRSRYQYGRGSFPVFVGEPLQHGYGLGGVFRGLMRRALPILKRGLTRVGARALNVGARALTDVGDNNTSLKNAMKQQIKNELNALKGINRVTASRKPISPPRARKRATSKRKRETSRQNRKGGFEKITL